MSRDHDWDTLRHELTAAVPEPPAAPDRMAQVRERRQQVRRRRAAGVVLAACLAVGAAGFVVPMVLAGSTGPAPVPPGDRRPTPTPATPALHCPGRPSFGSDHGPATLAPGATAARLCAARRGLPDVGPHDVLAIGLDRLVATVNAQPKGINFCRGPIGNAYVLLLAYPDGTRRRVGLDFSGCGSLTVGGRARRDPEVVYDTFMGLVRRQRDRETPPPDVPAPECMAQYSQFAPVVKPTDMVAALMCVTYNDNGRTTSTAVPAEDLRAILQAWRDGPTTPTQKTSPCPQTTPTWVLSGVDAWGDPVQITAECNRPSRGGDWVDLDPEAQTIVDRLVARAGVQVNDGSKATTAWLLAQAWIDDINARATISSSRTSDNIAQVANSLWVSDPWLPDGGLDWYLQGATRTTAPGWKEAWRVPARTPTGEAVFVIVRNAKSHPWRILSLTR